MGRRTQTVWGGGYIPLGQVICLLKPPQTVPLKIKKITKEIRVSCDSYEWVHACERVCVCICKREREHAPCM